MATSIYKINKGVNKSIAFKGLKAQYIWYMGAVVLMLIIFFAFLYIIGINQWLCLSAVGGLGMAMTKKVYAMNSKFGEHGMMKMLARKSLPSSIRCRGRQDFFLIKSGKESKGHFKSIVEWKGN
jgi:hypothetical protein